MKRCYGIHGNCETKERSFSRTYNTAKEATVFCAGDEILIIFVLKQRIACFQAASNYTSAILRQRAQNLMALTALDRVAPCIVPLIFVGTASDQHRLFGRSEKNITSLGIVSLKKFIERSLTYLVVDCSEVRETSAAQMGGTSCRLSLNTLGTIRSLRQLPTNLSMTSYPVRT